MIFEIIVLGALIMAWLEIRVQRKKIEDRGDTLGQAFMTIHMNDRLISALEEDNLNLQMQIEGYKNEL